jgi:DNA modification methylase
MTTKLILDDCMNVMRGMGDGAVEVVVTDPPYGIGENNKRNLSRANAAASLDYGEFDWDKEPASEQAISEILRVGKNQVIFGGNYFVLPPSSGWVVWDKLQTGDFADCELAWTSYKRAVRKVTYLWNGMIKEKPEKRWHPTQKPLVVMKWIVERYTKEGDTVFDPFMGVGTTGVACVMLSRNFIGVEISERYYAIAMKRIADAEAQLWLGF